jgi:thioredoxin-like negative regulator of GroEL
MDSLIAHLARKERTRLRVKRVDMARNSELARRLQVEVVPTLLLVQDKRIVERLEGRVSAPRIERMLEGHWPEPAAA